MKRILELSLASVLIGTLGCAMSTPEILSSTDVRASCAIALSGREHFPAWDATPYKALATGAIQAFKNSREDWRIFYQPQYVAGGDFLNFMKSTPFDKLSSAVRLGDDGVPMVLTAPNVFNYNPYTVGNFAMYLHSINQRGGDLSPAFWSAITRLLALQNKQGIFVYDYAWQTYAPGWGSGLAQGHALSVLARAYRLSGDEKYLVAGQKALNALLRSVVDGGYRSSLADIDSSLERYTFLEEYSAVQSPHTLNGFMWIILGLFDWMNLEKVDTSGGFVDSYANARKYFDCSIHTLASVIKYYDIGGYPVYDMKQLLGGTPNTAPSHYGAVVPGLLNAIYTIAPRVEFKQQLDIWANAIGQPVPAR